MTLPFSEAAFLDLFGAYNTALWPAAALLWLITLAMIVRWWQRGIGGRELAVLLAAHWAWSGVAYHWFYFRRINPAAALFGLLFVVQAALFAWLCLTERARFIADRSPRGLLGSALVVYGLLYPFLSLGFGLHYPRLPLFAVPCPTTLLTAGLLLASAGVPRLVGVIPILWAAIASSAAIALGIRADLALLVAGALLAIDMLAPHALGARPAALKTAAPMRIPG